MIRYLTIEQVIYIHQKGIEKFGGMYGIRDKGLLESAVARPKTTFGGKDLYKDVFAKASALGHSLLMNHPFLDGNKRTAFACMELFLQENRFLITASDDDCEKVVLEVINKVLDDKGLATWLKGNTAHILP